MTKYEKIQLARKRNDVIKKQRDAANASKSVQPAKKVVVQTARKDISKMLFPVKRPNQRSNISQRQFLRLISKQNVK